jgi:hypothetical protein
MRDTTGAALLLAIMAVALISALALSLSVLTSIEMRAAANYTNALEARNAAEVALEITVRELLGMTDWGTVTAGTTRSAFIDGLPDGTRLLLDGSTLDLTDLTGNLGDSGWRLFANAPLRRLGLPSSTAYIVVWVRANAQQEAVLDVRADAFGLSAARRSVQATLSRAGVLLWTEVR